MNVVEQKPFAALIEQVAVDIVAQIAATDHFTASEAEETEYIEVQLESELADSDVEVDGIFYGSAGNAIEVPAGLHNVTVSLPGYEVWSRKIMLREGQTIKADTREKSRHEGEDRTEADHGTAAGARTLPP